MNQWQIEIRRPLRRKATQTHGDPDAEIVVRSVAHAMGLRFRLGGRELPGRPHLVFPVHRLAVFVLDCRYYDHHGLDETWLRAGKRRQARQNLQVFSEVLARRGWRVEVIWACEAGLREAVQQRLSRLMPSY